MNIITHGLGPKQTLITRGLGPLYVVVDPDAPDIPDVERVFGGGAPYLRKAIEEGLIETRLIMVPRGGKNIEVNALLINGGDLIKVEAMLSKMRQSGIDLQVIRKQ